MDLVQNEVAVGPAADFDRVDRLFVVLNDSNLKIGVFRVDGNYYAYENRCQHQGGPVCEGRVLGKVEVVLEEDRNVLRESLSPSVKHLVCPWHGYEYDIKTGECAADRRLRLNRYEAYERDGMVYVAI